MAEPTTVAATKIATTAFAAPAFNLGGLFNWQRFNPMNLHSALKGLRRD